MSHFNKKSFLPFIVVSCSAPNSYNWPIPVKSYVSDDLVDLSNIPEVADFTTDYKPDVAYDYEIKTLNLEPRAISRPDIEKNFFKIDSYDDTQYLYKQKAEYYAYLLQKGPKDCLWYSKYLGICIIGEQKEGYFYPKHIFFKLKDGTWGKMDVAYDGIWTVYTYKNSVIYVNHEDATNPFDLTRSRVNIAEFIFLARNLEETTALQFIKYFFDFMAYQNGMKICYFDKKYFNVEFNNLGKYYVSVEATEDIIISNFDQMKEVILGAKENGKDLYCTKLYIDFPAYDLEAVKHVILLIRYENRFFIIDPNGCNSGYLTDTFKNAIKTLNITLSDNDTFQQNGNNCDTCASIIEVFISAFYKDNGYIPMKNNDIDLDTILNYAEGQPFYSVLENFFII